MSSIVIKTVSLSKFYDLNEVGTGTLSHDLNRWWAKLRGFENPYSAINDSDNIVKAKNHWALRNVNFDIQEGEIVGIIGKNGAGKSTLLKLLSKITSPTEGAIKLKGKIASLLEVGTGFHPDLTGRENIFLNGAILGMKKNEIYSKLDAIIDFAGIEKFIDTPVKRYSSGMYVRLGFAVAAFLEPDILIIDEVLAVGDADFQKKCLGRIKEVNTQKGRTVLFVSHNMSAIQSLCTRGIYLKDGQVAYDGLAKQALLNYRTDYGANGAGEIIQSKNILFFQGLNSNKDLNDLMVQDGLSFNVNMYSEAAISEICFDIGVYNDNGEMVIHAKTEDVRKPFVLSEKKHFVLEVNIPSANLAPGSYSAVLFAYQKGKSDQPILWIADIPLCSVSNKNPKFEISGNLLLNDLKSVTYPETFFSVHAVE